MNHSHWSIPQVFPFCLFHQPIKFYFNERDGARVLMEGPTYKFSISMKIQIGIYLILTKYIPLYSAYIYIYIVGMGKIRKQNIAK